MSIDNTIANQEDLSPLELFSRQIAVAYRKEKPRTAREALVKLRFDVGATIKEKKKLFRDGREDSLNGYFPQSADPVYSVGFQAGAIEQKYSL